MRKSRQRRDQRRSLWLRQNQRRARLMEQQKLTRLKALVRENVVMTVDPRLDLDASSPEQDQDDALTPAWAGSKPRT
jgi:hypothetical protein